MTSVPRSAFYQTPSIDPNLEYEVISKILLREKLVKRLRKSLNSLNKNLPTTFFHLIDLYREASVSVVTAIDDWQCAQIDYPNNIQPFTWNGIPYFEKMMSDISFLDDFSTVHQWLGFKASSNPFLIPPDILQADFTLHDKTSFVKFGNYPPPPSISLPPLSLPKLKSPYTTPLTNDSLIVLKTYTISRFNEEIKRRRDVVKQLMARKDFIVEAQHYEAYETFLNFEEFMRIRHCWELLNAPGEMKQLSPLLIADLPQDDSILITFGSYQEEANECLRLSNFNTSDNRSSGREWVPHEIKLLHSAGRISGELFVATAASTRGRLKPPTRPPLLRRLENEMTSCQEQLKNLQNDEGMRELIEATEEQLKLLEYRYEYFDKISHSGLSDIESERERLALADGHVRSIDEIRSIALEDSMATKIQHAIRVKFGRVFLSLLKKRRIAAAIKIQSMYRKYITKKNLEKAYHIFRIGQLVQHFVRRMKAVKIVLLKEQAAREEKSLLDIQRVFRGHLGRIRSTNKRVFNACIIEANEIVSPTNFRVYELEELAGAIHMYLRESTAAIPTQVVSLIRGILAMFNGTSSEVIKISRYDELVSDNLFANNLTWTQVEQLLRRKSKFLRRLRALALRVSSPYAIKLDFSPECVHLLYEIEKNIRDDDFNDMVDGQAAIKKLFKFVACLTRIFRLQNTFPENFESALPTWFHKLLRKRLELERLSNALITAEECLRRLRAFKEDKVNRGSNWGVINNALILAQDDAVKAEGSFMKSYNEYRKEQALLYENRREKTNILANLERTKVLGYDVSKRAYDEYINTTVLPIESRKKELVEAVDQARMIMLYTSASVALSKRLIELETSSIDIDSVLNLKSTKESSKEAGEIKSNLLTVQGEWLQFAENIGGVKYLSDATATQQSQFERMKQAVRGLLARRAALLRRIEEELLTEFLRVTEEGKQAREIILKGAVWDACTSDEASHEDSEDAEEGLAEIHRARSAITTAGSTSVPVYQFRAVLLVVDSRFPAFVKEEISRISKELGFSYLSKSIFDVNAYDAVENEFRSGRSVLLFADLGCSRLEKDQVIAAVDLIGNMTNPRVHKAIIIDFSETLSFCYPWSTSGCTILGKLRLISKDLSSFLNGPETGQAFREFLDEVSLMLSTSSPRDSDLNDQEFISSPAALCASMVSAVLDLFAPSILQWENSDIERGCQMFVKKFSIATDLCDALSLRNLPICTVGKAERLRRAREVLPAWNLLSRYNPMNQRLHFLLSEWCMNALHFVDLMAREGGRKERIRGDQETNFKYYMVSEAEVDDVTSVRRMMLQLVSTCFKESAISLLSPHDKLPLVHVSVLNQEWEEMLAPLYNSSFESLKTNMYLNGELCLVSVENQEQSVIAATSFHLRGFESVVLLNNIEVFEGKSFKNSLQQQRSILQDIASWIRLRNSSTGIDLDIIRNSTLIHTRYVSIRGLNCFISVFEEKRGEYVFEVMNKDFGRTTLKINNKYISEFLMSCDAEEVRQVDTGTNVIYLLADRISIRRRISERQEIFINTRRGPGRLIGRRLLHISGLKIIITLFEITNEGDMFGLRVCLYECKCSQHVEYRISGRERLLMFKNSQKSLIDEIKDLLRVEPVNRSKSSSPSSCIISGDSILYLDRAISFPSASEAHRYPGRVCWRGHYDGSKVNFGNDTEARKILLARREARVLELNGLNETGPSASYRYMDLESPSHALIVSVREILSTGFSVVKTSYSVDVFTHFGAFITSADIRDDAEIEAIMGIKHHLLIPPVNRSKVLEYIVKNRTQLKYNSSTPETINKSFRDIFNRMKLNFVRTTDKIVRIENKSY